MASRKFLVPANLLNLAEDPVSGESGDIYFNTTSDKLKIYDGTVWVEVGAGGGSAITVSDTAPASPTTGDAWYNNTDGSFYVYDGSFWVEVNGVLASESFKTISVSGQSDIVADTTTDTLTFVAGTNVSITTNATNDSITINSDGALTGIDSIESPDYISFDITPETSSSEIGTVSWNELDGTLNVKLSSDVTLQVGQEQHVRVHNETGSTITNGTVVYVNGASDAHGHISVAPYIADGSVNVFNVMGLATSDILTGEDGYVTLSGLVRGLDTSDFTAGDSVFASDTVAGGLTTTQPISPSETVSLGVVTLSDETNGTIFVQIDTGATADLVTYNHIHSLLEATNVKAALDELAYKKADINALTSNLVTYPTTASVAGISGYYRMVDQIDDPDYNDTAVNISTGNLNGTGTAHLISSLIADANLFVGTPGSINITTIGNIRKTGGNANAYSEFFFRVYHRDSAGTETLIGSSSTTGAVNPTILNNYEQFSASGNFLLPNFSETDRLVIKYYSNVLDDGTQSYEFQFGGLQPVRTLIPVPISVTPASNASGTLVDTSTFNGVLSGADSTVQNALETIDDIVTIPDQTGHNGEFLTTTGTSLEWSGYIPADKSGWTYDSALTIRSYDGITDGAINLEAYENKIQLSDDDGITITSGAGTKAFAFNNSGNIVIPGNVTFPDASAQTTAFLGISSYDTDDIAEGTNLYFTDERAQDAVGNSVGTGLSYNDSTGAISNSGVTELTGTTNEIVVSASTGSITIGIPDSPVFVTPDIGVATATSVNGTTIPSSKTLVVTTDIGSTVQAYDADLASIAGLTGTAGLLSTNGSGTWSIDTNTYSTTAHNHSINSLSNVVITGTPTDGQALVWDTTTSKWVNETVVQDLSSYLTISSAASTYQPIGSYLTSEADTLETVTDRGATSTNAITISDTTQSTTPTSGALIISGGVGIAKDVWIDGDLHVNGTTITENTQTVATHDNLIYLNAAEDTTITNAVGDGTYVTYTADNNYTPGMDIRVTGMDPAGYNISSADLLTIYSATSAQFVVAKTTTGTFVSGGTAHAKTEANPDLGFAGGYYNAGYAHAGLFRDASDGIFKFFDGYTPEPDEAVNIDTTDPSFTLADISANDANFTGNVSGTWNGATIGYTKGGTGLTSIGTAGQALKVNATADGLEWGAVSGGSAITVSTTEPETPSEGDAWYKNDTGELYVYDGTYWVEVNGTISGGGGGLSTTTTSISTNTATVIESFEIATSRTAEAIIQITQGTDYYSSKVLLIHDGTTAKITEYAILESTTGAIPVTISAAISGSNLELLATITDAATTNATAKVILIEVGV